MNKATKYIVFLFLFTCANNAMAQVNYVLNPSFEQYSKCPNAWDQIKFADHWSAIDSNGHGVCIPEYCNTCAGINVFTGIPSNGSFYHNCRSGNGMTQVYMFSDESNAPPDDYYRDYLQGRFYKSLKANKSYCISFFVSLEQRSQYAIDHIGAYLDDGHIDTVSICSLPQTNFQPQVYTQSIITDTLNWVKIEGTFIASGTEKFITIGNFFDKAHTNYIVYDTWKQYINLSWYLVDDVCVIESDAPAYAGRDTTIAYGDSVFIGRDEILPDVRWHYNANGNATWTLIDTMRAGFWVKPSKGTNKYAVTQTLCDGAKFDTVTINAWPLGIEQLNGQKSNWNIYPNPARNEIDVVNVNHTANSSIAIYDVSGRSVFQEALNFEHFNAKVHFNLAPGVYVVRFNDDRGGAYIERLVIY